MLPPLVSKCHHVRWMSVDKAVSVFLHLEHHHHHQLFCAFRKTLKQITLLVKIKSKCCIWVIILRIQAHFFLFCYVWLGVWSVCDAGPEINTRFFFLSTFACQDVRMSFNRGEKLVKSRWAVWALVCSLLSPLFLLTRKLSCVCVCNNVPACAHLSRR